MYKTLKEQLTPHGQEHLLQCWDDLTDAEKDTFSQELLAIDFDYIKRLSEKALEDLSNAQTKKDELMEVIPSEHIAKKSSATEETKQKWWNNGLKEISEGNVAVILLAGGQGTRLGVDYPKGMYNVGLPSKKTLYQLQAERILKLQLLAEEQYGKKSVIKWYIMTSEATLKATIDYFESHSYFGLEKSNVKFFEQHLLPCLTSEGKLILSSKGSIAKAPDGNGGLYLALKSANILKDMEENNIKHIQIYCVDNILVQVADPYFTGVAMEMNADCANKVILKVDPKESVGVTCKYEGKVQVVEYSEISSSVAEKRAEDGSLLYKDSNICLHYMSFGFLQKIISEHLEELPHHVAKKKIPFIDGDGKQVKPTKPNGMKLEKFVFDVFQYAANFAIFEVERNEEFSPLKNSPDVPNCSPVSCRKDVSNLHRAYLKSAGAKFKLDNCAIINESETTCEISPLISYSGEGLEKYDGKVFSIGSVVHVQDGHEPLTSSPQSKKTKQ